MRTGKLSISRGRELEVPAGRGPRLTLVPKTPARAQEVPPPADASGPQSDPGSGYRLVHDRLDALERLARLHSEGLLSAEEFTAEKSVVLNLPAEELILRDLAADPASPPTRAALASNPSLIGRMFSWKFLPVGLVAGFALSFGAQPRETMRFFDEALRLLGA